MYTYVQRPGCKKENTATYVYIRAGSRTPTRAYVRPGLVYMAGSERRNSVVVVFMGRQRNASCSSGGNGIRRVHREPTGLDGTGDGNEAWRTAERRKRPCVRPTTFETGSCSSGGVWRTAKRRKRTSYGRNGGPVDREGCGVPQNGGNGLVLERYSRNGGPVHREGCGVPQNGTPRDTVHLHRRPPPASTGYRRPPPASTGSCSSSLHRALLHRLLFNHPSTGTPPPSTVHPALHTTGSCSSRGNATAHCSSTTPPPPATLTVHPERQHRSASVSSSSEGIARSGSVNSHRSIARVQ